METVLIRRSRKTIRTYLIALLIIGLPFSYLFCSMYVDPIHNEDRDKALFFLTLLNLLWVVPFFYLLSKLLNSLKPEIILTINGIEFRDKKQYKWEDVIGYILNTSSYISSGDAGEVIVQTLIIYFRDRTGKSFRITEFPFDQGANDIFNLFDQFKMNVTKTERKSWVLKINEVAENN